MNEPARLTWLVGPPGAGKSTYARRCAGATRVVELTDMLGPLVNPLRLRKGILSANGSLVRLIRALELHPENLTLPPLLVVAGLVPEEALLPLSVHEKVLLLLPARERWLAQLHQRPVAGASSRQYDDYDYAERWYDRFSRWPALGIPCERLETPFEASLLGQIVA